VRMVSTVRLTTALALLAATSFCFQSSASAQGPPSASVIVATKKTKYLLITLTTSDGKFKGGENRFCVVFESRETAMPAPVQNVSVNFRLLVGKIEEAQIQAEISGGQEGRFCGRVNLGKQYYVPASYYAFLSYSDATGKRRKQRLFVRVG